jgi:hypothetical protein
MLDLRRVRPALWIAAALALAVPSSAGAATQIGAAFPGAQGTCAQGETILQSSSPGSPPQYAAPSPGVITSWSFHATPIAPSVLKFKVARPAGGNLFTIIGESPPKSPAGGVLSTYTDVRIPAQPGDVLGFYSEALDEAECFRTPAGLGFDFHAAPGDQLPGSTPTGYTPAGLSAQMSISAVLEPDADNDGYGDETQDQCPTDAAKQEECDPPETTITKAPANKSEKPKAKFKFASDEPDSSFECKLKGKGLKKSVKQFGDCDSPRKYKRLDEGKFKFKVRAIDAAGNVDPSPAKDKFRVVD